MLENGIAPSEMLVVTRFPYPSDRRRLVTLLKRGWRPMAEGDSHPLTTLQGKPLDGLTLQVMWGPTNRFGARYFQLFLQDQHRRLSEQPAVVGLHGAGKYPGYNWVEVISTCLEVAFAATDEAPAESVDLTVGGLETSLFQYLADLIPPGGHLMVEYDSRARRSTEESLLQGIPPAATPLGELLFRVGCGAGFKDWYISEGGNEGPRKLQGHKAMNQEQALAQGKKVARELMAYLQRPFSTTQRIMDEEARRRARQILESLK